MIYTATMSKGTVDIEYSSIYEKYTIYMISCSFGIPSNAYNTRDSSLKNSVI